MRHDDVLDVLELVAEGLDLAVHGPITREMDREVARDLAPVADRVVDDFRVTARIEQHEPFGLFDQGTTDKAR